MFMYAYTGPTYAAQLYVYAYFMYAYVCKEHTYTYTPETLTQK